VAWRRAHGRHGSLDPAHTFRQSLTSFATWEGAIRSRTIVIISILILAVVVGVYWLRSSKRQTPLPQEYVISPSLDLLDSPAVVHTVLAILQYGDRVEVMRREGDWARVRVSGGNNGWVNTKELVPAKTYLSGQQLLQQLSDRQIQATGRTVLAVNLHLEPGREAPELGLLSQGQSLDVYDRRMVARNTATNEGDQTASAAPIQNAWYLVRSDSRAGWVLGRMLTLDIPQGISQYAADYNTVAWFVLNTVRDGDSKVPQYLVADREGTVEFDFTHIRVFTWSLRAHHYVTSYVQSGLRGSFPIRVEHVDNVPYFRLRLVDAKGNKFQGVYGLFDTIVRPIGTVEGWESNVMPERRRRR
jgi:Bacterial SH3 domain